jgi:hypothetical protein
MEEASYAHAREDMTAHRLIDLRNQARLDLRHIERQLERTAADLEPDYRAAIDEKMSLVRRLIDEPAPDADGFLKALTAMDHATIRLAEIAIKKTLDEEGLSPAP